MAATPEEFQYTSIRERIRPDFDLESVITGQTTKQNLISFIIDLKLLVKFEENKKTTSSEAFNFH